MSTNNQIRNIAIIAHVDHGKTTLMDVLFKQTNALGDRADVEERVMDSNPLEKERGITILAKTASLYFKDTKVNVVDTPGHADFGGEVERILNMVDGVLLLVDAFEGPMPQTRFVTRKALQLGLKPILVINKIDRPGSRPDEVMDAVFNLFVECGANDDQLDFPYVYASAKEGYAIRELDDEKKDIIPLLDLVLETIPAPEVDLDGPFQMMITDTHYDNYLGALMVGRVRRGKLKVAERVVQIKKDGSKVEHKIQKMFAYEGLNRIETQEVGAGDIAVLSGVVDGGIGETLCNPANPDSLEPIKVEEPTISMNFSVNDGTFAGKEGKFVTSRQVRERLMKEQLTNIALRVEETDKMETFKVSGRGELHLSILIETMRREGYEFLVSRPKVLFKEIDGKRCEPVEDLQLEVPEEGIGAVMEELGRRKAEIKDIAKGVGDTQTIKATIPTRGLIGFRSLFLTLTRGEGIMYHSLLEYQPHKGKTTTRKNGVLIAHATGESIPYAIFNLQDRGTFIIPPNVPVYEGMVVGIHSRDNDLSVNVCATKKLSNVRASGKDDAVRIVPHKEMSLEQSLEFIEDDELVEVTPKNIRIRKMYLTENERKRHRPPKEG